MEVKAGKFRALKLVYTQEIVGPPSASGAVGMAGQTIYWYSPEVKYFVKGEYDKSYSLDTPGWELTSLQVKK